MGYDSCDINIRVYLVMFTTKLLSKAQLKQLGLNHVCVILSRLHDTMYHICVTLHFSPVFDTEKKYLAEELSLDPWNIGCICSKFPFQINFGAKEIS